MAATDPGMTAADQFADAVAKRLLARWRDTRAQCDEQARCAEKKGAALNETSLALLYSAPLHELFERLAQAPELLDKCLEVVRGAPPNARQP